MRVAIMQPTYLPWIGYFDLMDQVDCFVFLDSVQFEKQSWQQRNRIKVKGGLQWITLPIHQRFGEPIQEVEIRDLGFPTKHLRAIELAYRRAPHFERYFEPFAAVLRRGAASGRLVDVNLTAIAWMASTMGIKTRCLRSSGIGADGKRCELLGKICERLMTTEYLSPVGSASYLLEDLEPLHERNISVLFHHYIHPEYQQRFPPFVPFACGLDLLFNEGDRSAGIMRSGRREPLSVGAMRAKTTQNP